MANRKSKAIGLSDAKPGAAVSTRVGGGRLYESVGVVAVESGDAAGSVFRLVRVASTARVSQVLLYNDALTGAAANIGVHEVEGVDGGAVVGETLFASAKSLATANSGLDLATAPSAAEKPLWEALGLAEDPCRNYDIAVTLTAAASTAGSVALKVRYVDGN
ncbi:MAG: hypothetical protein LBM17_00985 [Candidatus Accumulibacter sp.]|jgi:hypothetical protein|nr:hypothetical protein [Accumulibacter sp.]